MAVGGAHVTRIANEVDHLGSWERAENVVAVELGERLVPPALPVRMLRVGREEQGECPEV